MALTLSQIRTLRRKLLAWYEQHRRDLPWRRNKDPYRVWVSEIMLQQTRVAAVLEHYARFMRRFPSLRALAAAREQSVLAAWSGLGYYHRARRMHQAAKLIVRERGGVFPTTAEQWSELPGIGRYTAAAIASIAFGQPVAVVDGNVERVLERLTRHDGGREAAWQHAQRLLDPRRPGDFNQAAMELGASICTPRAPQCLICPLNTVCQTKGMLPAPPTAARKCKHLQYALVRAKNAVLLARRPAEASLMAGMWELPVMPAESVNGNHPVLCLRHSITDTDYRVAIYAAPAASFEERWADARWFTYRQCERLPLTGVTRKVLRRMRAESAPARRVSK